jgi:hypothetical protein
MSDAGKFSHGTSENFLYIIYVEDAKGKYAGRKKETAPFLGAVLTVDWPLRLMGWKAQQTFHLFVDRSFSFEFTATVRSSRDPAALLP